MATVAAERRRRRKNRSSKKTERCRKNRFKTSTAGATTTTVHDLPDHVLERILLCLGPSPCLVRAAAACKGWCRVVADAGFLARLRSAHPHGTRLGHYHGGRVKPIFFVPFLPMAAIVVRHRRRFNLDFLPGGNLHFLPGGEGAWELLDSRDSLLLLAKLSRLPKSWHLDPRLPQSWHLDLLVYEPLTGRHQRFLGPSSLTLCLTRGFLVDGGADESCRIGKSIFRVLAVAQKYVAGEYVASVFCSGNDGCLHLVPAAKKQLLHNTHFVGRANGSIYWAIRGGAALVALDEATVQFFVIKLPGNIGEVYNERKPVSRVIGGEDGALRIIRLMSNELKVFVRQRHPASDVNDDEWVLEKHLGLPEEATMIATANSKYVILTPAVTRSVHTWLFSVELDTMRVEREHERSMSNGEVYRYELPWPPILPDIISH